MFVVKRKKEQNQKSSIKQKNIRNVVEKTSTSSNQDNVSRVKKNEYLYGEQTGYDLFLTKQQKFNFDNSNLGVELEDEFKEEKAPSKNKRKKPTVIEKKVFPKKLIASLIFLLIICIGFVVYHFKTFDHNKVKIKIKTKTVEKEVVPENIVFLGDSLTEFYDLEKFYPNKRIVNSGIGGNITDNILKNMQKRVYQYNPSKVILLIGTNDIQKGRSIDEIIDNIKEIITGIENNRSKAELYIESLYPVNRELKNNGAQNRHNEEIKEINEKLQSYCKEKNLTYIDVYSLLEDEDGNLKEEYTKEGLHLSEEGYEVVTKKLSTYLE